MSPEGFEKILSSSQHITKNFQYEFIWPWLGQGLLTSSGQRWRTQRKLLTPSFHFRILKDFLEVMNDQVDVQVQKLGKVVADDVEDAVDIYPRG